jgi:hypothetical protein
VSPRANVRPPEPSSRLGCRGCRRSTPCPPQRTPSRRARPSRERTGRRRRQRGSRQRRGHTSRSRPELYEVTPALAHRAPDRDGIGPARGGRVRRVTITPTPPLPTRHQPGRSDPHTLTARPASGPPDAPVHAHAAPGHALATTRRSAPLTAHPHRMHGCAIGNSLLGRSGDARGR